jgi:hypothetical protein
VRSEDTALLIDYCEGKGRFSEINTFGGMESTNRTMILPDFILALSPARQREFLAVLVDGAAGQTPEAEKYIGLLIHPLLMLVVTGHSDLLKFALPLLESVYSNAENVEAWTQAEDNEALPSSVAFKKTWHYALILARILHGIGSVTERETTDLLRENAASFRLRNQLASLAEQ